MTCLNSERKVDHNDRHGTTIAKGERRARRKMPRRHCWSGRGRLAETLWPRPSLKKSFCGSPVNLISCFQQAQRCGYCTLTLGRFKIRDGMSSHASRKVESKKKIHSIHSTRSKIVGCVFGEMRNLRAREMLEVYQNPPTFAKIHQISSKSR